MEREREGEREKNVVFLYFQIKEDKIAYIFATTKKSEGGH